MKKDAQEHAAEDKKRRDEIDVRNQADNLVYSTDKQLKDLGDKIPEEHKAKIVEAKEKLEAAIKDNPDGIRTAMDAHNAVWSEASTQMYQGTGGPQGDPTAGADPGQGGAQDEPKTDTKSNVEEADYTVVDEK
jgi:molecular chaperone DnaK